MLAVRRPAEVRPEDGVDSVSAVLPTLGAASLVLGGFLGAFSWRVPEAGEFRGQWWTVVAAVPGAAWTLISAGVLLCGAGGVVLLWDRCRGRPARRLRYSPLLRGVLIVLIVTAVWGVGALQAEATGFTYLSDPSARNGTVSQQVRRVVSEDELPGEIVHRAVEVESVSPVGPMVVVSLHLDEQNSSGAGTSGDLNFLADPLSGRFRQVWFFGLG